MKKLVILLLLINGLAVSFAKDRVTKNGLKYDFFKHKKCGPRIQKGDVIFYHLILKTQSDSVIFDTHLEYGVQQIIADTSMFKGDLQDGFTMLRKNDSVLFYVPTDSLYGQFMPAFAKSKEMMKFYITIQDFMTQEKLSKKLLIAYNKQLKYDDSILQASFLHQAIVPAKTSSGLYYIINQPGTGENAKENQTIKVNYTGKFLTGKIFDSSIDPTFQHVEPFEFKLATGAVIKGWDEGLQYFNKGAKGTLYIPSVLAYGKRASGAIAPNSILIFEVEVVDIK
jgi:FKBP-type peptidyl-prolyl cis-trans isomerase FkpA